MNNISSIEVGRLDCFQLLQRGENRCIVRRLSIEQGGVLEQES